MQSYSSKTIFNIQLLTITILSLILAITSFSIKTVGISVFLIITFFINRKDTKFPKVWNILLLPYIFIQTFSDTFNLLLSSFKNLSILFYALYCIGMLFLLIPLVILNYSIIKNYILRLLASIWVIFNLFLSPHLNIINPDFLIGINNSQFILGVMFLIYGYYTLKIWGYHFYFNLKVKNWNWQSFITLLFLLITAFWIASFNTFISTANDWYEALFKWDISLINPHQATLNTLEIYLSSLGTGILEETSRYIFLICLLPIFKNHKGKIAFPILLSSIIFSLLHILNAFSPNATFTITLFQILHAFGFGILMATLFLFTGKLWLPIIIHAFGDFLSMALIPIGYGTLTTNYSNVIIGLIIITLIPLIMIIIIFLIPQNNKIFENNIKIILQNNNIAV